MYFYDFEVLYPGTWYKSGLLILLKYFLIKTYRFPHKGLVPNLLDLLLDTLYFSSSNYKLYLLKIIISNSLFPVNTNAIIFCLALYNDFIAR